MVFLWSLSDSKTPQVGDGFSVEFKRQQVSSGLQGFSLASLNNVVVWMVSDRLPISDCSNLLGTVPSAPTSTGITATRIFRN